MDVEKAKGALGRLKETAAEAMGWLSSEEWVSRGWKQAHKHMTERYGFNFTSGDETELLDALERLDNKHFYVNHRGLQRELNLLAAEVNAVMAKRFETAVPIRPVLISNPVYANNAAVLPNGTVLFDLSLLELLTWREELAFILAHEAAHVAMQHAVVMRNLGILVDSAGNWLSRRLAGKLPGARLIESLGKQAFFRGKFYRTLTVKVNHAQEFEADKIAAETLSAMGFNPGLGASFMQRIASKSEASDTHPAICERMARLGPNPPKGPNSGHPLSAGLRNGIKEARQGLSRRRLFVRVLASVGALLSTALIGAGVYGVLCLVKYALEFDSYWAWSAAYNGARMLLAMAMPLILLVYCGTYSVAYRMVKGTRAMP